MTPMLAASLALLTFASVVSLGRVLRHGSLVDRALGLDFLVVTLALGVVVDAVVTGSTLFIPLVVAVALVAFLATVAVARFVERNGA